MISVKNLVKSYGGPEPAVKGVSFEIEKGEIVGLLGPNGAGKTTIMKVLTCFMTPTAGEVFINGMNVLDDPIGVKKLIGYLPEHTPQYGDMTVYEYLTFIASIRGLEKAEMPEAIQSMVELASLESVISKKINQLSNGYRKRVGLASVMIHDPEILILDEPTTGLDPNQIITFRKILRKLSEKKTVILSTHILSEIEATCERVVIIKNGNIVANDSLHDLVSKFSQDEYVDFDVKAEHLLEVENELRNIKEAWQLEFLKKEAKDVFRFRALTEKGSKFEDKLNELITAKGWELVNSEKGNANLEEIFLKLAGEEE